VKKLLIGLALGLAASAANAQSVLQFNVVFDTVYEASGAFAPNLNPIIPGPFNPGPIAAPNLTGTVTLTSPPSSSAVTSGTITLNGSWSTVSGYAPASSWGTQTMTNATYNLGSGFFGLDFFSSPTDWAIKTSTAANGQLSDQGPESIYGGVGTCPIPVFFGVNCQSAMSGGSATGTQPQGLFAPGTQIYNGAAVFGAGFRNTGNHGLTSGTVTTNAGIAAAGLGFENGIDAFALDGVLDTANSQGNGNSQLYPDGVGGRPGKVRLVTFSNSGNTAYMLEGHVTYSVVPVPAAVWMMGSALGLLGWMRRRATA
jgi:hypothetical protein